MVNFRKTNALLALLALFLPLQVGRGESTPQVDAQMPVVNPDFKKK